MNVGLRCSTRVAIPSLRIQARSSSKTGKYHTISNPPRIYSTARGTNYSYYQPQRHSSGFKRVMDIPDGIPKWSGHKGKSELMQEMSADEGYGCQSGARLRRYLTSFVYQGPCRDTKAHQARAMRSRITMGERRRNDLYTASVFTGPEHNVIRLASGANLALTSSATMYSSNTMHSIPFTLSASV